MALTNDAKKEINAKIVYMGPAGAGKATMLRYIYGKLKPEYRSELKCTSMGGHQMLFFDFTYPQGTRADGYQVRFHIYTIAAGTGSALPWKMLLKGVDGVVFVADSACERVEENMTEAAVLRESLAHYGVAMGDIPFFVHCNKRDLKDVLAVGEISMGLFPDVPEQGLPVTAATGEGLLDGLHRVVKSVLLNLGRGTPSDDGSAADIAIAANGDLPRFPASAPTGAAPISVELSGDPVMQDDNSLLLPLRLVDAGGSSTAEFTITIAVNR